LKSTPRKLIATQQELIMGLSTKLQVTERRKKEVEAALQDANRNKKLEAEIKELRKKCEDKNKKKTWFIFWRMRADAQKLAGVHEIHHEEGDTNIELLCNRITRLQEILEEKQCG